MTNQFEEETAAAKDAIDKGAQLSGGDVELKRSGGDVERSGGDVERGPKGESGGDIESGGDVESGGGN